MSLIILIDDQKAINELQKKELENILVDCGHEEIRVEECTITGIKMSWFEKNGDFSLEGRQLMKSQFEDIVTRVKRVLDNDSNMRVEVVIDLCLDDSNLTLGIKLAKCLITANGLKEHFEVGKLLITLTSQYISADYSGLADGILDDSQMNRIEYCHRPIDIEEGEFDKEKSAFPEFYYAYRTNVERIDALLSSETYYGNYTGLICARIMRGYKEQ